MAVEIFFEGGNQGRSSEATCLVSHWQWLGEDFCCLDILISFLFADFQAVSKKFVFKECGLQAERHNALRSLVWQGTRGVKGVFKTIVIQNV